MSKKGIYPCIWLLNGKAVKGFDNNETVSEDPAGLVKDYAAAGADGVIIFDRSSSDAEHEASIDLIRRICEEGTIPVIGAGNIRRMEDVKKLIYAGCELAALNLSKESNRILAREVCERFGKERIAGCYRSTENLQSEWKKLAPWLSMGILLDAEGQAAADSHAADSEGMAPTSAKADPDGLIPVIACVSGTGADALTGTLCGENIAAVSGYGVNALIEEGPDAVSTVKNSVQEDSTDQVLMVAYMNEEAYNMTLETGRMTYYSRSRQSLWIKGETSGHFQYVRALYGDCDMDTLLARVVQIGAACHTGSHSCFFNRVSEPRMTGRRAASTGDVLREDYQTIIDRRDNPKEGSYTNYLFDKGIDKILKKLGEENTEIVIAAKNPGENEIIYEIADYLYHLEVLMAEKGVDWDDITRELVRRQKKS